MQKSSSPKRGRNHSAMKCIAARPANGIHTEERSSMTTEGFADDGTTLKDLAQFDLAQEMKESEQKRPWPMGHFAKTLFKKSDFRMVLIMMDSGSLMKEHHADGTISVQVLKGSIDFRVRGETHGLSANSVLTLGASIKHEL